MTQQMGQGIDRCLPDLVENGSSPPPFDFGGEEDLPEARRELFSRRPIRQSSPLRTSLPATRSDEACYRP